MSVSRNLSVLRYLKAEFERSNRSWVYITHLPLVKGSDTNWTQMQLKLYLYKVKVLYHEISEDHDYEVKDNINIVFYTSAANTVQVGLKHLYSQIMYVFLVLSKGINTLGNFTTRTPTSLWNFYMFWPVQLFLYLAFTVTVHVSDRFKRHHFY